MIMLIGCRELVSRGAAEGAPGQVSVRLRTDAMFMALLRDATDGAETEPEMVETVCRGQHEELVLKRFLMNEVQKTLSELSEKAPQSLPLVCKQVA